MRKELKKLKPVRDKGSPHPGLLLQRYLCENATGDGGNPAEKRAILQAAITAATNDDVRNLYRAAFDRWSALLPSEPAPVDLTTMGRLIVGLGSENVLETGIRLHHTYGMPMIPGSALKGLAAHYCDQVWGPTDEKFRRDCGVFHQLLFGTTDESGCIAFHDSWLTPDSRKPLVLDVMTPHHPKWLDGSVPPTDFDSPVPVPFLSATGTFRVAVSWHGPTSDKAKNWAELALSLLCDALYDWGAGGKTSSGYGRFDREKSEAARKDQEEKKARLRREQEEQAKLAAMSPIERNIKEFLDSHPDKKAKDYIKLLKELEKADGRFQTHEDRRAVAVLVKSGMQADKVWKEKDPHGKRKKLIEGILGE